MAHDIDGVRAEEEKIKAEVEELGRVSEKAENTLYNIALRQDELGREPTNMLESKLKEDESLQELISRELLTYDVFDNLGNSKRRIASLYVTLKGMRYCIVYGDELNARRRVDPAGRLKSSLKQD